MSAPRKRYKIGVSIEDFGIVQARIKWDVRCPNHLVSIYLSMLAKAVNDQLEQVDKRQAEAVKALGLVQERTS